VRESMLSPMPPRLVPILPSTPLLLLIALPTWSSSKSPRAFLRAAIGGPFNPDAGDSRKTVYAPKAERSIGASGDRCDRRGITDIAS